MFSSIQFSSISSCSGLNPTAPSTPKPPALLTATTTSRQWVKAKIGNPIPRSAQIAVRMAHLLRKGGIRASSSVATPAGSLPLAHLHQVGEERRHLLLLLLGR